VRNRFTIDTDIVFDGEPGQDLPSPQEPDSNELQRDNEPDELQQSEAAGDTDRWVEEQFDLEEYEDPEVVKETDILSDDDDMFCQAPRASPAEADLEAPIMALSLNSEETNEGTSRQSPKASGTPDDLQLSNPEEQSAVTDDNMEDQKQKEKDEIWVRRQQSSSSTD